MRCESVANHGYDDGKHRIGFLNVIESGSARELNLYMTSEEFYPGRNYKVSIEITPIDDNIPATPLPA